MPNYDRKYLCGFVDPLSLITLGFLVVTLLVGSIYINKKGVNLNLGEKASSVSCAGLDKNTCSSTLGCKLTEITSPQVNTFNCNESDCASGRGNCSYSEKVTSSSYCDCTGDPIMAKNASECVGGPAQGTCEWIADTKTTKVCSGTGSETVNITSYSCIEDPTYKKITESGSVCEDTCSKDTDCGQNQYCYLPSSGCPQCKDKGSFCTPGVKKCSDDGKYLQTCNTNGTSWDSQGCGGSCNPETLACNEVVPEIAPEEKQNDETVQTTIQVTETKALSCKYQPWSVWTLVDSNGIIQSTCGQGCTIGVCDTIVHTTPKPTVVPNNITDNTPQSGQCADECSTDSDCLTKGTNYYCDRSGCPICKLQSSQQCKYQPWGAWTVINQNQNVLETCVEGCTNGNCDDKTKNVTQVQNYFCTPNASQCLNNEIYLTCNSTGTAWSNQETCFNMDDTGRKCINGSGCVTWEQSSGYVQRSEDFGTFGNVSQEEQAAITEKYSTEKYTEWCNANPEDCTEEQKYRETVFAATLSSPFIGMMTPVAVLTPTLSIASTGYSGYNAYRYCTLYDQIVNDPRYPIDYIESVRNACLLSAGASLTGGLGAVGSTGALLSVPGTAAATTFSQVGAVGAVGDFAISSALFVDACNANINSDACITSTMSWLLSGLAATANTQQAVQLSRLQAQQAEIVSRMAIENIAANSQTSTETSYYNPTLQTDTTLNTTKATDANTGINPSLLTQTQSEYTSSQAARIRSRIQDFVAQNPDPLSYTGTRTAAAELRYDSPAARMTADLAQGLQDVYGLSPEKAISESAGAVMPQYDFSGQYLPAADRAVSLEEQIVCPGGRCRHFERLGSATAAEMGYPTQRISAIVGEPGSDLRGLSGHRFGVITLSDGTQRLIDPTNPQLSGTWNPDDPFSGVWITHQSEIIDTLSPR